MESTLVCRAARCHRESVCELEEVHRVCLYMTQSCRHVCKVGLEPEIHMKTRMHACKANSIISMKTRVMSRVISCGARRQRRVEARLHKVQNVINTGLFLFCMF